MQEHRKKLDDMEEIMRQRYADMQTKREKLKQRRESIRLVNTEAKDTKEILNSIISRSNISASLDNYKDSILNYYYNIGYSGGQAIARQCA